MKAKKGNTFSIVFVILLLLCSCLQSWSQDAKSSEEVSGMEDSKTQFDFQYLGLWPFVSFLQDEKDDALSLGIEFGTTLEVGNTEIKNINYFEVNRYPRAISGQPIGNSLSSDTVAADGINDLLSGLWFTKRNAHSGKHHFAPGIGLMFPTASDPTLGSEKFSLGPSFDYEYGSGNLFAGIIVIQLWSVAGADDRKDVNMLVGKPFVFYNFSENWDLIYVPYGISIYWNKPAGEKVYLPLGGGIRRSIALNDMDLNLSVQFFNNVIRPEKGTVNDLRFWIELAF